MGGGLNAAPLVLADGINGGMVAFEHDIMLEASKRGADCETACTSEEFDAPH